MAQKILPNLLGLNMEEAERRLRNAGVDLCICVCSSRKGVPDADGRYVIRQRLLDEKTLELTVSDFKTDVKAQEPCK
jgi:hypothetical protein